MPFSLDEANKIRESIGKSPLTPDEADVAIKLAQGNNPVRDAALFMQAVVNAPNPEKRNA